MAAAVVDIRQNVDAKRLEAGRTYTIRSHGNAAWTTSEDEAAFSISVVCDGFSSECMALLRGLLRSAKPGRYSIRMGRNGMPDTLCLEVY